MTPASGVAQVDHAVIIDSIDRETGALLGRLLGDFLDIDLQGEPVLNDLTGGHIVTHLSREADRMADQFLEVTGRPVPAFDANRRWEVHQGGLRPGAVLIEDFVESADRLKDAVACVEDWPGLDAATRALPARRLVQLVIHHADLKRPWDSLPEEDAAIAVSQLPQAMPVELARIRLVATPGATSVRTKKLDDETVVEGSPRALLAWASGRVAGLGPASAGLPDLGSRVWF